VALRTGRSIEADLVVLAVSFDKVMRLVPEQLSKKIPALASLDSLHASPIVGVHLWFDKPVCPFDHVVTPGRIIQWVFNHTAIQGRREQTCKLRSDAAPTEHMPAVAGAGQYLQVVISASYDLLGLDKFAVRDAVLAELAEIWPAVGTARLLRSRVVIERGATFSVRPGVDALRPSQRTGADGLFFAGDWTDTRWPATMEGAVRSGYLAAQEVLRALGQPTRLVRPALRQGLLARCLFGETEASSPGSMGAAPSSRAHGGAG
jgi:uncharacterized protein with NAD-binding domain and iron-sulfur cluster